MRIYSMTATFGKLEHRTLTLQPGLNIIEAPNEWGKSTWCAFLAAMLYGIETRTHSTKSVLADKERYAPWSGSPMSGRMDLCWNGRNITIERRTRGRAVFGDFKAYETESGIPISQLTAANCGQMLLGVEKSVFLRAGFLRLTDLPVTQDEALRRRLNALVTTGDESGTADALAGTLKDIKNKLRFNRSGLLPQAEAQKAELEGKLRELEELYGQAQRLQTRQEELKQRIAQLENHRDTLNYEAARVHAGEMAKASAAEEAAAAQMARLEQECAALPTREEAQHRLSELQDIHAQMIAVQDRFQALSTPPEPPETAAVFSGMTTEEAARMVRKDTATYRSLKKAVLPWLFLISGALLLIAGLLLMQFEISQWAPLPLGLSGICFLLFLGVQLRSGKQASALEEKYGASDPAQWQALLETYTELWQEHQRHQADHRAAQAELEQTRQALKTRLQHLLDGQPLSQYQHFLQNVLDTHSALETARREYRQAADHAKALEALNRPVPPPKQPDLLTHSEAETARLLAECTQEQQQLQLRLGQYRGQMETLGDPEQLRQQLSALRERIRSLEDTYAAVTLALSTLSDAAAQLQRRFAPQITARARSLFSQLTDGKYDRLTMGEDLNLFAGAQNEDTLRASLWRSDGTVDQLYFVLRLAVAEALTPQAPLVLDDALVRFDDRRLKAAMDILREMARSRQIILFTCQSREKSV